METFKYVLFASKSASYVFRRPPVLLLWVDDAHSLTLHTHGLVFKKKKKKIKLPFSTQKSWFTVTLSDSYAEDEGCF